MKWIVFLFSSVLAVTGVVAQEDSGLERLSVFVSGIVNGEACALGSFSVMPGIDPINSQ